MELAKRASVPMAQVRAPSLLPPNTMANSNSNNSRLTSPPNGSMQRFLVIYVVCSVFGIVEVQMVTYLVASSLPASNVSE